MEWSDILFTLFGIVATTFFTWGAERLIVFLNSKVSNVKYVKYINSAIEIVQNAVKVTYQTYVEDLKATGNFKDEYQKSALLKTAEIVLSQMPCDMQKYISQNFGDIDKWIENTIEAVIYDLKRNFYKK